MGSLKFGPYPADRLTYKSDRMVEYRTVPQATGLGTTGNILWRLGIRLPHDRKTWKRRPSGN